MEGRPAWQAKAFFNGLGALATLVTLFVVGISKFIEGAWITILLIPAAMIFSQSASVKGVANSTWTTLPW